jgi:hypothetical protein
MRPKIYSCYNIAEWWVNVTKCKQALSKLYSGILGSNRFLFNIPTGHLRPANLDLFMDNGTISFHMHQPIKADLSLSRS